jgi:subtilisin family serine protease
MLISYPAISQFPLKVDKKEQYRIIAKIDTKIVSNNTLTVKTGAIKSFDIQELFKRFKVKKIQSVFRNRYNDEGKLKNLNTRYSLSGWYQIMFPQEENTHEFIHLLKKKEGIQNAYIETPVRVRPAISPNDTDYGSQWHLNYPWNPIADIDAELAWEINRGRNDVVIAVCDGGVDYTHSDLDPGDRSRVIEGYDSADDDEDPMDDLPYNEPQSFAGHGTNVAGIIGAITDNDKGVAGVMWNCKIMPVKMVGDGGVQVKYPFGSTEWNFSTTAFPSDVADAIDYAVNNGAHVINLSYGFEDMGWPINDVITKVPLLYESISNAYANNLVTVVSMGNEYQDGNPINYPAAFYNEVIAVGNTNSNFERAPSSSTGPHINVSAPGTGIWTTERGGGTEDHSGTSMSAPVVSGVAGLIISQGKDRNFNLTNDDVRHILEITADDIELYGTGFDNETGHGKVNAKSALELLSEPNELFHWSSEGGNAEKIDNYKKWSYIGNDWGLASGMYFDVDVYEITKHITFDVPFCSPPEVWLRDRQCVSISFSNPNIGYPWAKITNITKTGFDIRYAAFFVRRNFSAQQLNTWVPAKPEETGIDYTVVGRPNNAALAGPINGSSTVCASNTTYSLNNLPSDATVTWSATPHHLFTDTSGTGSSFSTAWDGSESGYCTITATFSGDCGSVDVAKYLWLGKPQNYFQLSFSPNPVEEFANTTGTASSEGADSYIWDVTNGTLLSGQGTNTVHISAPSCDQYIWISVTASNSCGDGYAIGSLEVTCRNKTRSLQIYPVPADDQMRVTIEEPTGDKTNIQTSQQSEHKYYLYNDRYMLVKQGNVRSNVFQIATNNLPEGFYFLKVVTSKNMYTRKLEIRH